MESKGSKFMAELVGTFALVFVGAGAVSCQAWSFGAVGLVGIALAHGLILAGMIYTFGHISGTHVNPAVTLGLVAAKKMDVGTGIFYIVAQLLGAVIAGFSLRAIFPGLPNELGTTDLAVGVSPLRGLLTEGFLTFLLVTVVLGAAADERAAKGFAGIAIGLTLAACILMGGPVTGASLNPARTFGPAIASGHCANHWIYWAGPIAGGIVAALLNQAVFRKKA